VEEVLCRHEAVSAAAVVARPDAKWGEAPAAFVELREGEQLSETELLTFCREHLAGYKLPKSVVFGPLPRTSTGKVQKYVLRSEANALFGEVKFED
jgi:fatty-acyl-CoA synthase